VFCGFVKQFVEHIKRYLARQWHVNAGGTN
jgi:hypothetical protein